MKLFSVNEEKKHIRAFVSVLFLMLILTLFCVVSESIAVSNRSKGKEILNNALERSITQCYALEGSYPPNLDYLVNNYGLTYDTDRYFIDYQYIGDNLRPDTTIIEREP